MLNWQRPSAVSQLAVYLRSELERGRWAGRMPGVIRLAYELGVARNTVEGALKELERLGLLVAQGQGKGRVIRLQNGKRKEKSLRVVILNHEPLALTDGYLLELPHFLQERGFSAVFADQSLADMQMNVTRVAKLVKRTSADAWVVASGSREILEWFMENGIPVFSLFGRRNKLVIAGGGPDKSAAYRQVVRDLVALGHRRIVLLARKSRRLPEPGLPERAFMKELAAHGIIASNYNLPDWEENPEDLQRLLDACFQFTPPTAFLVDEAYLFHAVKHHLCQRCIKTPEDVSLICTDPDRSFAWCRPSIAHIRWDSQPLLRRILRWADHIQQGKDDRAQINIPAELVMGGTVGRAKS